MREITEIWKPVFGYEGVYAISNNGNIVRIASEAKPGTGNYARPQRAIKARKNNNGYMIVDLWFGNRRKQKLVHRLVAEAFVPNPDRLPEVNHKDENPENCCADNLEWCDRKYNMNYGSIGSRIAAANSKPVLMCDNNWVQVKSYPSIIEAQRQTGISQGSIGDCLHGRRKTAGGYKWQYAR